jgi:hypothetical protein
MVGNGRGEKSSGRFMRVGRSRLRVNVLHGVLYARERGGGSGDETQRVLSEKCGEGSVFVGRASATDG